MPLTADDVIQENSGTTASGTSHAITLPSGTTAGNTVIIIVYSSDALTAPAGFVTDAGGGSTMVSVFRKSEVGASETSWTFTSGAATTASFYVFEAQNIDPVEPLDVTSSGTNGTRTNGQTQSTGTTSQNAGLSVIALAGFGSVPASSTTWDGYTNGFEEVAEPVSGVESSLSVARKFVDGTTGTFETTATIATSGTDSNAMGRLVVYRAADAPVVAPLVLFTGFEWGTHGGLGNTGATSLLAAQLGPSGTFGTNYLIQAASGDPAYVGNYFFRVVQTGGSGGALFGNFSNLYAPCFGFPMRVNSATGTPILFTLDGTVSDLNVVYDSSTNKVGVRWGTGTVSYESGTTALGEWKWIDIRQKANTTTHHADWRIETSVGVYTDQTSPADATGGTGSQIQRAVLGGYTTSQTVSVDFGGMFASSYYVAYPLGPHYTKLLVPETTGATVSGTSSNFSKFTANGTLAAWAGDAGALLDDVPPTVSAASDGVVQTAVAASDYMEFPMTTYTCAPDEIIAAVRALFSEWGGTGSGTGTIGYRGYDGTTETTFVAASASYDADSLTAISATYPLWKCAMWASPNGWTQTELNAAALRVGFSTDATPDMGISAAYLEVAVRTTDPPVITHRLTSDEDPEAVAALVTERLHPYTSGVRTYTVSNDDATRTAEFRFYETGGAEHADSPVIVAPLDPPVDVTVHADAFGEIESTTFGWQ